MKDCKSTPKNRHHILFLALLTFASFSTLIIQFYQVQIISGEKWTSYAQNQHEFIIKEPFRRGTFYSNTSIKVGHPEASQALVIDVPKFHLHIDPKSIPETHRSIIAESLFSFLNSTEKEKTDIYKNFARSKHRNRKLTSWIDRNTRDKILNWWKPYARKYHIAQNALFFVNDYQRSYPFNSLLGQALHTIRDVKKEKTKEAIPTGGLELYFNHILKGKLGKRRLLRSPRHALETGNVIQTPENGADIYLTINHYLQAIAEEELKIGTENSQAKSAWAIIMDPYSGDILALAQYPAFNPSKYQDYYSSPELIPQTKVMAVTNADEPASSMKAITLAIALQANKILKAKGEKPLFSLEEKIATDNGNFPGRTRPLKDGHLHRYLNANLAMQTSSNIYFAILAQRIINRLGTEWYRNELTQKFQFGTKTGIQLPAESAGFVPTPKAKYRNGTLEWSKATPFSIAIGHNIQTNSLQSIAAFNVFANGGYLVKPNLIRKIVRENQDGTKHILLDNTTSKRIKDFRRVVDPDIAEAVKRSLMYVTKFGGTGRLADVNGYTEAGKTGTSKKIIKGQYSNKHFTSFFVGFAPAKNPRFTILIGMDEPAPFFTPGIGKNHQGGQSAAPVFSELARRSLEYLGISPDDPYGYPRGDPRSDPQKAIWNQERKALKRLYDKWNT